MKDSTRWFALYGMIARGEKSFPSDDNVANECDFHYLKALIEALYPNSKPCGDGKFSRVCNFTKSVSEEADWVRRNFIGRDEDLEAFLGGVLATVQAYDKVIEKIKKGH